MTEQQIKVVINIVTGQSYTHTFSAEDGDLVVQQGTSQGGLIHGMATVLGLSDDRSGDMKFHCDGVGWVAFNPRHVVSVEFHGTEDVE